MPPEFQVTTDRFGPYKNAIIGALESLDAHGHAPLYPTHEWLQQKV